MIISNYLLLLVITLQLADIVTTYLALKSSKGTEGNSFAAAVMRKIGVLPALLLLKGAFIGFLLYFSALLQPEVLAVLALGYCWVLYNNLKILFK